MNESRPFSSDDFRRIHELIVFTRINLILGGWVVRTLFRRFFPLGRRRKDLNRNTRSRFTAWTAAVMIEGIRPSPGALTLPLRRLVRLHLILRFMGDVGQFGDSDGDGFDLAVANFHMGYCNWIMLGVGRCVSTLCLSRQRSRRSWWIRQSTTCWIFMRVSEVSYFVDYLLQRWRRRNGRIRRLVNAPIKTCRI